MANQYHRENYCIDFEYDEFIPMVKAEHFDPAEYANTLKLGCEGKSLDKELR